MRLDYNSTTGTTPYITFDSLYSEVVSLPAIEIDFDDCLETTYLNAFLQGMQPHNLTGTAYVRTGQIRLANCLSAAELLTLQAAGWTVGNHTRDHTNLADASYADALTAIQNGDADLNTPVSPAPGVCTWPTRAGLMTPTPSRPQPMQVCSQPVL